MSRALLEVESIGKTFRGNLRAVDDVSFTLDHGETLGLVGESGSGKSTLGRLVLRLIEPSSGRIWFDRRELTSVPGGELRRMRRHAQMVFQDPFGSLDPRMTVGSVITEPMAVHGVPKAQRGARLAELMRRVGLDPTQAGRYPHQFSGGQRQRIGIARALAVDPKLLVLDEPVSALDVSIQAQIINLLRALQRDGDLAFLFIAHDLAVVRHVSHRVAVMYLGRIVEIGPRDAIYTTPAHPYTITLLSAVALPDPVAERARQPVMPIGEIGSATRLPAGCRFHPRCPRAQRLGMPQACTTQDPKLRETASGHAVACHFPETAPSAH